MSGNKLFSVTDNQEFESFICKLAETCQVTLIFRENGVSYGRS